MSRIEKSFSFNTPGRKKKALVEFLRPSKNPVPPADFPKPFSVPNGPPVTVTKEPVSPPPIVVWKEPVPLTEPSLEFVESPPVEDPTPPEISFFQRFWSWLKNWLGF